MSRPPLEVADLIRSAGAAFIERNRQWLSWKHIKVLLAIARCRTAALGGHSINAPAVGIVPPFPTTAAAIDTARSVRPRLGNAGSRHVKENFSRRATSMWSSHFLRSSLHWLCRTRKSSTICCSAPVQKHFSKSLAIRDTSARKSASSPCCIPGTRSSGSIPMSIASFPPVACHSITPTG